MISAEDSKKKIKEQKDDGWTTEDVLDDIREKIYVDVDAADYEIGRKRKNVKNKSNQVKGLDHWATSTRTTTTTIATLDEQSDDLVLIDVKKDVYGTSLYDDVSHNLKVAKPKLKQKECVNNDEKKQEQNFDIVATEKSSIPSAKTMTSEKKKIKKKRSSSGRVVVTKVREFRINMFNTLIPRSCYSNGNENVQNNTHLEEMCIEYMIQMILIKLVLGDEIQTSGELGGDKKERQQQQELVEYTFYRSLHDFKSLFKNLKEEFSSHSFAKKNGDNNNKTMSPSIMNTLSIITKAEKELLKKMKVSFHQCKSGKQQKQKLVMKKTSKGSHHPFALLQDNIDTFDKILRFITTDAFICNSKAMRSFLHLDAISSSSISENNIEEGSLSLNEITTKTLHLIVQAKQDLLSHPSSSSNDSHYDEFLKNWLWQDLENDENDYSNTKSSTKTFQNKHQWIQYAMLITLTKIYRYNNKGPNGIFFLFGVFGTVALYGFQLAIVPITITLSLNLIFIFSILMLSFSLGFNFSEFHHHHQRRKQYQHKSYQSLSFSAFLMNQVQDLFSLQKQQQQQQSSSRMSSSALSSSSVNSRTTRKGKVPIAKQGSILSRKKEYLKQEESVKKLKVTNDKVDDDTEEEYKDSILYDEDDIEDEDNEQDVNDEEDDVLPSPIPLWPGNYESYRDDEKGTNCWSEPSSNIFKVRGKNYLRDKVKVKSPKSLFPCLGVDVWLSKEDNPPMRHIIRHPSVLGGTLHQNENNTKVINKNTFVVNFLLPFGNFVSYFEIPPMDTLPPNIADVWTRFYNGDQAYRDARLKLLPVVVNGPWVVRKAVGNGSSPAVLGKAIPLEYYRSKQEPSSPSSQTGQYLEVDVVITSSRVAKAILNVVKGHANVLTLAFAFIIEATCEKELPECVLCNFQIHELTIERCPVLPDFIPSDE